MKCKLTTESRPIIRFFQHATNQAPSSENPVCRRAKKGINEEWNEPGPSELQIVEEPAGLLLGSMLEHKAIDWGFDGAETRHQTKCEEI